MAPDDAEAAYEVALAYHASHDLLQAIRWYQTARTLDTTNGLIHTSLRTALVERGLMQDALAQFHTTFEQARRDPAAAYNLALVAERSGLVEEAIYHYRQYATLAPYAADTPSVLARVGAMAQAIEQRQVRILKLATRPAVVQAGRRAQVVFTYSLRGWGKYNQTGVVEQVSLYRDDIETHRFVQRSIRADNKRYTARLEILVPPNAAPGPYTLVAQVIAGSRRDDQVAVFTIAPGRATIPEPIVETASPPEAQVIQVPAFPKAEAAVPAVVSAPAPTTTPPHTRSPSPPVSTSRATGPSAEATPASAPVRVSSAPVHHDASAPVSTAASQTAPSSNGASRPAAKPNSRPITAPAASVSAAKETGPRREPYPADTAAK